MRPQPEVVRPHGGRVAGGLHLVELAAFIALANFYARSNVAFGIESDGFAAACDLKPLSAPTARPEIAATA